MAILCVQFADKDTEIDSRGSVGLSPPPFLHPIEHKYRYGDYWNIIFQATDSVRHPDADFPPTYARGRRGFFQYGSMRRYIEDNSYGQHTIMPYRAWSQASGLLNTVTPDSSGNPHLASVNWLTLSDNKMLNDTTMNYGDPHILADSSMRTAIDSLDAAWDSLDVVIILFAGVNTFSYAKAGNYTCDSLEIPYAISSERTGAYDGVNAFCFKYPSVVFHEFLHAAFGAEDLHSMLNAPKCSGVGHFSLMGDNAPFSSYTPPMLDPWHKLRYGWLRYYVPDAINDTLNLVTPIDTTQFHLPIVSEPYDGGLPYVLVIPVKQHPDQEGWNDNQRHYIIVENRRAVGWDKAIAVEEMDPASPNYGVASGIGGFLLWGSTGDIPGWVYDADGDFGTWAQTGRYGAPGDLFDGDPGRNVFSVWSDPNVFSKPVAGTGAGIYNGDMRNVYIEFPPYIDSSNVNPISRLVLDRFVPAAHSYGDLVGEDVSSTRYGTQQKIDAHDSLTLAMFRADGKTFVMSGKAVDDVRNVACLNYAIAAPDTIMDNGAVTWYPPDSLLPVWRANYIWQKESEGEYWTRLDWVNSTLSNVQSSRRKMWGPFQQQPRPVITSREQFGVLAFAGNDGIYTSVTTNAGDTWTEPEHLDGSEPGSGSPSLLMDSETRGNNAWLLTFVNRVNLEDQVWLYSSATQASKRLSSDNQTQCANPNPSRLEDKLSVVYQYHDENPAINLHYVARIEMDLTQGVPPNDIDAFGWNEQEHDDVNRDPTFLYTNVSDAGNSLLYWVFNKGEKLLSARRDSQNDSLGGWFQAMESVLSSKPTSYPHLLYHEADNPKLALSRSGTFRGALFPPDSTPSLIVMTRDQELDANPALLRLHTELGMHFSGDSGDRLMHARWSTPVVMRAYDTIAIVSYDYHATKDFFNAPMDTLTRTRLFEMTDEDVALFALDLSLLQSAPDTIVFESRLVDPVSGQWISSSGEIHIPPMTGDTTVLVGMELPNGYPPTDCFIATSMTRGYYQPDELPRLDLVRYMLYSAAPIPKRSPRLEQPLPQRDAFRIYPQPARGEIRFVVEGASPETATVLLYDLLGRRVAEAPLLHNGRSAHGRMQVRGLAPGMYILAAPGPDGVRTAKVVVTQ